MLVRSLPSKMWSALDRWHGEGAWGRYFDNPAGADDLELEDWQVIDLAGAAEHEDLCEAALFYLLERMRLALENPAETARLKLMVVDEAWRYLRDPAVLSYLAEAAKTWRKKNAALIVATQSAVDVTGTAGAEALLESMPTKLFLAKAMEWPFLVAGMWHDGRFTYLRSNAQESPALYELKDGKPSMVAYDLGGDGLYIARHLLGEGWLQIGKKKVKWRFTPPEPGP